MKERRREDRPVCLFHPSSFILHPFETCPPPPIRSAPPSPSSRPRRRLWDWAATSITSCSWTASIAACAWARARPGGSHGRVAAALAAADAGDRSAAAGAALRDAARNPARRGTPAGAGGAADRLRRRRLLPANDVGDGPRAAKERLRGVGAAR